MSKITGNKILSLLLVAAMVFTLMPLTAAAEANGCTHDCAEETCAYTEGADCRHQHDESCGEDGVECTHDCADGACGYTEAVDCDHRHDENCGGLHSADSDLAQGDSDKTTQPTDIIVMTFDELADETLYQGYGFDTVTLADLDLPNTLAGRDADGEAVTIEGVTWQSAPDFDPAKEAAWPGYIFSPVLPQGYILTAGVTAPVITVFIQPEGGVKQQPLTVTGSLSIGGSVAVSDLTDDSDGSSGVVMWAWDAETATLTLTGTGPIGGDGKIIFTAAGEVTVTVDGTVAAAALHHSTYTAGKLTINGSGTLSVSSTDSEDAIYARNELEIADLTVNASTMESYSIPVYVESGDFKMESGTLNFASPRIGIASNSILIGGTAAVKTNPSCDFIALSVNNDIVITGGTVDVTSTGSTALGAPNSEVRISGGTVKCSAESSAVFGKNGVTVSGGTLITGDNGAKGSVTPDLTVDNAAANVTINGNVVRDLTVSAGTVTITGTVGGNVTVTGGTVLLKLALTDSPAYDIPGSFVGIAIDPIDLSPAAKYGTPPYTFSAAGLPAGITINKDTGVISGTPTATANAGTATITVTDSTAPTAGRESITIAYGAVIPAPVPYGDCGDPNTNGGKNVKWNFDSETGILTISGAGAMANYNNSDNRAPWHLHYKDKITAVEIKNGVLNIGNYAFYECAKLGSITIPGSVITIGNYSFDYCFNLGSVTIPGSVINIGNYAFYNCTNLGSVTILAGVKIIGSGAFYSCDSLTSVTIPDGLTTIDEYAFNSCSKLSSVSLPDSVTSIGQYAFGGCKVLSSIIIQAGVNSIGTGAFYNCTSLSSVTFKRTTPPTIGADAFTGLAATGTVTYPAGSAAVYKTVLVNTDLFNWIPVGGSCGTNVTWSLNKSTGVLTISGTGAMADYVREADQPWYDYHYDIIKKVVIENGVTSIGNYAFRQSIMLTSVIIPDTVTKIGSDAFGICSKLTGVTIPNSVITIGSSAFASCTLLDGVTLPNKLTTIEDGVFNGCSNLTNITIPDGMISIGDSAFRGCTALNSVTIPDSVKSIGDNAFRGCTALNNIFIPTGVSAISNMAFYDCRTLSSVFIPAGVTDIGSLAFYNCTNLSVITFMGATPPTMVETGGNSTFGGSVPTTGTVTCPAGTAAAYRAALANTRLSGWTVRTDENFHITGGNYYMTLQEAIDNVPDNGVVTMLRDTEAIAMIRLNVNKTYTLDLGGYTLSNDGAITWFLLASSGNITIKNGTVSNASNGRSAIMAYNGADITIESGTYHCGGDDAIYCGTLSTVTIVSGQFSCTGDSDNGCLAAGSSGQIVLAPGSAASIDPFVNNPAATSVTVALANAETPNIVAQPVGANYDVEDNAAPLTVAAAVGDGGTLSYQWYRNTTASTAGGTPVGTNTASYTPDVSATGTLYYYVVVTNTNNSAGGLKTAATTSGVATVTVGKKSFTSLSQTAYVKAGLAEPQSYTFDLKTLLPPGANPDKIKEYSIGLLGGGGESILRSQRITGGTLTVTVEANVAPGAEEGCVIEFDSDDYTISSALVTFRATAKTPVKVSGVTVESRVYNGDPVSAEGTPVFSDAVSGEPVQGITPVYIWSMAVSQGDPTLPGAPCDPGRYILTVTAEGGESYEITPLSVSFEITAIPDTTPPILSAGSVSRESDTQATIGFTTDEAGKAYYLVLTSGASAPASTIVKTGTSLDAVAVGVVSGKSVTLTAGAKDIYIVVEDAAGNISQPLKIEAAAYVSLANFQVLGDSAIYATLEDAVADVPEGGTITMLQDVAISAGIILNVDKTYTLDLDGHTLSNNVDYNPNLHIQSGTVTIKNGGVRTTAGRIAVLVNGATVTIESGTYAGLDDAICCQFGKVTIVSGQFSCTTDNGRDGCLVTNSSAQMVLAAGSAANIDPFVNNQAAKSVTVTGSDTTAPTLTAGTFTRTSDKQAVFGFTTDEAGMVYFIVQTSGYSAPTSAGVKLAGKAYGAVSAGVVSGIPVSITADETDIFVVVEDTAGNLSQPLLIEVASYVPLANFRVTGSSVTYNSLEDAAAAVPANGTITMSRNVTVIASIVLNEDKAYTLDLGGYTLTKSVGDTSLLRIIQGAVAIKNGEANNSNGITIIVNGATVVIESGTYVGHDDAIYSQAGTVTIVSGQFSCTSDNGRNGCLVTDAGQIVLAPDSVASVNPYLNSEGATSVTITAAPGGDTTPPTGNIQIGAHGWNSFWNTVTFGLLCKNTQTVTITGSDDSGTLTIQYYLSADELTSLEAQALTTEWQPYSSAITINPNNRYIVYAKLSDPSGNSLIINSAGIVLYTDSAAVTTSISFTKGSSTDQTADVTLNGNTINKIINGTAMLTPNTDYTVSGGTITFKASYFDNLAAGSYTLTVYYNPLGVEYPAQPLNGSEVPATTAIALTVSDVSAHSVTVLSAGTGAAGSGSFASGAAVSISAGTAPTGMRFKNWTASPNVTFTDANSASTTFTMIGQAVTVTANFEALPATVTGVTVNPSTKTLKAGDTFQFGATVQGMNNPDQGVTWSVTGGDGSSSIAAEGALTVGATETDGATLTVTATSAVDVSMSNTATITVSVIAPPTPTITSIEVTPATITLNKGDTHTFSAVVKGMDNPPQGVTWTVEGGNGTTAITSGGALTIAADETATTLTIKATSAFDTGVFTTATVTVTQPAPSFAAVTNIIGVPTAARAGTPLTLTGTVVPVSATNQTITWSVSPNNTLAGVSVAGTTLNTANAGTAIVRATIANGLTASTDYTQDFNITVSGAASSIYTITFDPGSGSVTPTSAQTGADGKLANLPTPTISGSYFFKGWYTAASGGTRIAISYVFSRNTTIYAQWEYTGGNGGGRGGSSTPSTPTTPTTPDTVLALDEETPLGDFPLISNPFTDVKEGDWFYDNVMFAYSHGLFSGTSATTFGPGASMTRAMFVTVLARLAGVDTKGGDTWYAKAMAWAVENGISDGTNPNAPITREQMAAVLYNYMQYMEYALPSSVAEPFADENSISAWALEAASVMQAAGIITGRPGNMFDPQATATRAEVATIFTRFVEWTAK